MIKLIYNSYLLYRFKTFGITGLQTNSTLMLTKNLFTTIKGDTIKIANIIIKKYTYFIFKIYIKFNDTLIKYVLSNDILLIEKVCINNISLVIIIKSHDSITGLLVKSHI